MFKHSRRLTSHVSRLPWNVERGTHPYVTSSPGSRTGGAESLGG